MDNRAERRRQEKAADRAADANGAPETPKENPHIVRTVVAMAPDMVHEFAQLMKADNPLARQIHRELQHVHGIKPGGQVQLCGILVNVAEPAGDTPEPSRILRPGGTIPNLH